MGGPADKTGAGPACQLRLVAAIPPGWADVFLGLRPSAWAVRARERFLAFDDPTRNQFGIVQGGVDPTLRAESARRTVEIGFDGYGIGGLSVGESRDEMLPALAAAIEELPTDQPRYLMGLGDPVGIVESIALGVDLFDDLAARQGELIDL